MSTNVGLETLLDLAGSIIDQGSGYWIKIDAWVVEATDEVPHGIRYTFVDAHQLLSDFFAEVDRVLVQSKLK
jgi:hypothetical protein